MGKEHLGRGWSFPMELGADGKLGYVSDEEKVAQSLLIILGTARGERVMQQEFGSRLHELVFAPAQAASTRSLAARYATEAITRWEPRVDVVRVDVSSESAAAGKLLIAIDYRIRATNSLFNLVYPFYLREGIDAGTEAG